ncbi:MAG: SIMPL domain-containing protein [Pseudonocardiaceae bacterium]
MDNTLVVVGIGTVTVTPEVADVTIRLEATASTPGAALGRVTEASQAVLAASRDHGVTEDNLRTHRVSAHPQMDPHRGRFTGYAASHTLALRLTQISAAPTVIDAVAEVAGDTFRLEGLHLLSPDTTAARSDAAVRALADARGRAERLAEAAGAHLGPVISIVEEAAWGPSPGPGMRALAASTSSFAGPPIQAGTDEVTACLTVTFQMA